MRIALDAMGGDHAPREIVSGAVDAARGLDGLSRVILVGDEQAIRAELDAHGELPASLDIVHAPDVIGMDEKPAQAVRRKRNASICRAVDLVKAGEADAVVSAGNTGAAVAAAALKLRTLEGIERPAIATVMPTPGRPFVLLDAGATVDCSPRMLLQFAAMGTVYSRLILGQSDPVTGLLSIGAEDSKGNDFTRESFALIQQSHLRFRGNIEGHDLYRGETDVVICDGFTGNIVLKTSESVASAIGAWMREEFRRSPLRMLGALLLRGALRSMKHRLDPELSGGAPLLGINGVCIITHGASSRRAIFHAVRVAVESVQQHLNEQMIDEVRKAGAAA